METIELQVYSFSELSESAKRKALNDYVNREDFAYIYDDAYKTVKEFNDLFKLKEGRNSWLEYQHNFDDNILELKGLRLRTYLINNFEYGIRQGKYIKTIDGHRAIKCFSHKNWQTREGKKFTHLYSKLHFDNWFALTGVCYDDNILEPIYNFIDKYRGTDSHLTIIDLLDDCFATLEKAVEREIAYLMSEEAYEEHCDANDYRFTEDGKIWR